MQIGHQVLLSGPGSHMRFGRLADKVKLDPRGEMMGVVMVDDKYSPTTVLWPLRLLLPKPTSRRRDDTD